MATDELAVIAAELSTKHVVTGDAEVQAVTGAVLGGDLSGNARLVGDYERALARWFGVRFALACSSGTAALHLALLALGVGADDEVIVPPTAPAMTALPVLALGARPIFADTRSVASFALDPADVDRKRTRRTKAVVSVPMWGYPADDGELVAACRGWRLPLIEDAAQAHGTRLDRDGRLAGTQGAIGCFSTHARKLICTGEGGFVLTADPALAARLATLRNLGQPARLAAPLALPAGGLGEGFGLNYKLAALPAALGLAQLDRLAGRLHTRRRVARRLLARLADVPGLAPLPVPAGARPNHYALVLQVHLGDASLVGQRLAAEGVVSDTVRYGYRPLYQLPVFSAFTPPAPRCPNAEALCASIITLPCHEGLTAADERRIIQACRAAVRQ
jgi:dTDP-4-amino-4,6-dideoxygalactose transaminase